MVHKIQIGINNMIIKWNWLMYLLTKINGFKVDAISLPFFIITREKVEKYIINHEQIHQEQIKELGVLGFYAIYIAEYLFNLIKYRKHKEAYKAIRFEVEAYGYEKKLDYLKDRVKYAWRVL